MHTLISTSAMSMAWLVHVSWPCIAVRLMGKEGAATTAGLGSWACDGKPNASETTNGDGITDQRHQWAERSWREPVSYLKSAVLHTPAVGAADPAKPMDQYGIGQSC
jgi:hypothetical protein